MFVRDLSTVELTSSCVVKKYTCSDWQARVQHLEKIYKSLTRWKIPNTDHIQRRKGNAVYLVPRGFRVIAKTNVQVREVVCCVLEALVVGVMSRFVY
jgi:hypothetical protein